MASTCSAGHTGVSTNSQLEWPAASTQVDGNLAILAEVRLFAGESRLDELERGDGVARRPVP